MIALSFDSTAFPGIENRDEWLEK